jgi:hypothetical protein
MIQQETDIGFQETQHSCALNLSKSCSSEVPVALAYRQHLRALS